MHVELNVNERKCAKPAFGDKVSANIPSLGSPDEGRG